MKATFTTRQTPVEFFVEHAGFSYDPTKETPEQGKLRCAQSLADAERIAHDAGASFEWATDGRDSTEWTNDRNPPTPTWECVCRDAAGNVVGSLCGVDFGDSEPWGQPYRRVVEAEIANEAIERLIPQPAESEGACVTGI